VLELVTPLEEDKEVGLDLAGVEEVEPPPHEAKKKTAKIMKPFFFMMLPPKR
jgi:hypothetical protein